MTELLGRLQSQSLVWMVSGQILWALHFIAVYGLMSVGCAVTLATTRVAGVYLINLVLVAITLVLLLAIAYLGWASWRYWHQLRAIEGEDETRTTAPFMAFTATLIHAVSLLAVLWVGLPLLISPPCV